MTDRERLGLPEHFVLDRFSDSLPEAYERLRGLGQGRLAELCEELAAPLVERLAAGGILALIGDPRLDTLHPPMVRVPGETAEIGLAKAELDGVLKRYDGLGLARGWIEKECPRHKVSLRPYALGRYPVTNWEYRDFLLETGFAELPTSWAFRRYPHALANHPVYTVTPEAADAYAAWLSRKTGRLFRLPTEAEWEFAAAGPKGLEFPWGEEFDAERANTAETGLFQTSPVGAFAGGRSPFGASDMAGNVEEYVADNYAPYPDGEFVVDHLTQIHGQYRVARGGGFARFRDLARTRRRHGANPSSATYAMGFRIAEDIG
jgi:toxoflavin biosynthesis protein ToxD